MFKFWYQLAKASTAGQQAPDGETPTTPSNYHNPWPEAASYTSPIVISSGGTYMGNWKSTDPNVPAVKVMTAEPVSILNFNVDSTGNGIEAGVSNTNITLLNGRHFGGALSSKPRRFIVLENFKNLVIENCYLQSSAGIYIAGQYKGNGTTSETVRIRYCKALNIDGRITNGYQHVQFFQSNTFRPGTYTTIEGIRYYDGVPHMEIGWIDIHNQPGLSHVEDNINIYNTRGTPTSPLLLHNIFIHGANYWDYLTENYSGSGIISDSPGANRGACTAYMKLDTCSVIMSNGAPFGVAGGNNITLHNCVGVSKSIINAADATRLGVSGNETELRGYPSSVYVTDTRYNMNSTYNVVITNYTDGVVGEKNLSVGPVGWRNDYSDPTKFSFNSAYGSMTGTTILSGAITEAIEQSFYTAWDNRKTAAGVTMGVVINPQI